MIKKSILVVSLLALSTSITALASDNSTDLTTNIFIQEVILGKWSPVISSTSNNMKSSPKNSTDLTTNISIQEVIHGKWSSVANSESSKPINNSKQWKEASELYTNQFSSKY